LSDFSYYLSRICFRFFPADSLSATFLLKLLSWMWIFFRLRISRWLVFRLSISGLCHFNLPLRLENYSSGILPGVL
jgi:hypothetical protein